MIIKNKLKDNFTIIPNEIISDKNLSNNAFRLLVYLWSKPSDWEVNQKNIAKDFDVHINSVSKWIKELKEIGYINILKRNIGQSFEYVYELVHDTHYSVPREDNDTQFHDTHSTIHTFDTSRESVLHNKTEFTNTEFTKTEFKKTKGTFVKPTIEELENYCKEKELKNIDPEQFINFYESNGWMVGKNKMKNWKAAASNWNKRNFNNHNSYNKQRSIGSTKNWNQVEERKLSEKEIKEMQDIISKMKGKQSRRKV